MEAEANNHRQPSPPPSVALRVFFIFFLGLPGFSLWFISALGFTFTAAETMDLALTDRTNLRYQLLPLTLGLIGWPILMVIGHTMGHAADLLAQLKRIETTTSRHFLITLFDALRSIIYALIFAIIISFFATLTQFSKAIFLVPLAGLSVALAVYLRHLGAKLRTQWEEEAHSALPSSSSSEGSLNTQPR